MGYRVLIVGSGKLSDDLADILKNAGHSELFVARDGRTAVETARVHSPDVVLMDIDLPGEDSLMAAQEILIRRPVPIIVHASYSQFERVKEADEVGVSAHLFRPVTRENLLASIELGMSRFRQCQALRTEVGECKEALRVRKLVERAKGILMKRNSITEEEAFLSIQKLSRDSNITMEKVAESIITASEII